jgi:hypothetical protein
MLKTNYKEDSYEEVYVCTFPSLEAQDTLYVFVYLFVYSHLSNFSAMQQLSPLPV